MRRKRLGHRQPHRLVALVVLAVRKSRPAPVARAPTRPPSGLQDLLPARSSSAIPVFTAERRRAKEAAKKLGDTVTYNGPTEASAAEAGSVHRLRRPPGLQRDHHLGERPERRCAGAQAREQRRASRSSRTTATSRKDARTIFVSPPTASGRSARSRSNGSGAQIGYKGDIAILSATPTAANQNTWIKFMKADAQAPEVQEHEAREGRLRQRQPDRLGEGDAGTRAGVSEPEGDHLARRPSASQSAAQVLEQAKASASKVALTGLGLPNQMRKYIKKGCAKKFGLWDERELRLPRDVRRAPRPRREADRQDRPDLHRRAGLASARS